uniref:Secreted protein n=1 Tax=Anopheles quadriannulatus TaxID=34691 RepID=A0A182X9V9_ANOQN
TVVVAVVAAAAAVASSQQPHGQPRTAPHQCRVSLRVIVFFVCERARTVGQTASAVRTEPLVAFDYPGAKGFDGGGRNIRYRCRVQWLKKK